MKKLLVTVIGATAAIGAFAYTNTVRFVTDAASPDADALNAAAQSWNGAASGTYVSEYNDATKTNEYSIGTLTGTLPTARYMYGAPTNELSVKTRFGKPLEFRVDPANSSKAIGSGLYFDSLVKFTVCDGEPEDQAAYNGAKIMMWLQETDTQPAETNLYVKAGYLWDDNGALAVSNFTYQCGNTIGGDFADKWHRVTIKAIEDITLSGEDGAVVPGFAIFIDGDQTGSIVVSTGSTADKWYSGFTSAYTLTEAATHLNSEVDAGGALFPSMVLGGTAGATAISSASFDGTGWVNDIAFTDVAPFEEAEDYVAPRASIVDDQDNPIAGSPFKSLAAAVEAANGLSSGTYTFALTKGEVLDGTLAFNSSANIILDFAGFVLTNTSASVAAISNAGNLTIINSTVNVGGIYCSDTGAAVSQAGTGALVIGGGVFNGDVDFAEALDVTVTGGSFKNDETYFETDERTSGTWIADGMKLKQNQTTGLYDVVVAGVASIGDTEYATLKDAVDAAQAGDTVTVLKDCEVTAPIEFRYGITLSNDYTIATKADYALRMRNGTTTPVTICGTGAIAWDSGSGSPVMVGNNEASGSKVTSYGYEANDLYSGYLVLQSGTIRTGAIAEKKGNMIKVESGTFVMNGGAVTGHPTRCIKADAENGDATATVIINGGVISNSYATAPVALNAAKAGNGSATVTINGGQITGTLSGTNMVTIPAASTAQFDRDQTAFCVADYKTALSAGWYVVTPKVYYTAVLLNKNATSIETNLTETLTATFTPASAADDAYTWESSAPAIATVDQNGVVMALAAGEATITVTATHDSSVTASCTVTVTATEPTPAEPTIDPASDKPAEVAGDGTENAQTIADSVSVTIPDAAKAYTTADAYQANFDKTATYNSESGKWEVTAKIAATVEETAAETAAAILTAESTTGKVTVPAGLYYKVTRMINLGTPIDEPAIKGISDGEGVSVGKPGSTQGFIQVEIGTGSIE